MTIMQDKNPSPLNNLDFLLNHTYMQIIDAGTQTETFKVNLRESSLKLSCALELILSMLKIRFKVSEEEYELLRSHFTPDAATILDLDAAENSWEDVTNASLSYLLKNSLGKSKQGSTSVTTTSQIKPCTDIEKLKQNIANVCEKISKGSHIEY